MIKTKVLVYILACAAFVAYLFSADYLFNVLLKTDQEARITRIMLPMETRNLKFHIDGIKKEKTGWKDALHITGWVFRKEVRTEKRNVSFVLKGTKETMVFDVRNDSISRRDVTKHFEMEGGIDNHGFELYIPVHWLKEKYYQIGCIIVDETGRYYQKQNKIIKTESLLGNADGEAAVPAGTVMKHQFLPDFNDEREIIYSLYYQQDPNGDKRRHLVEFDDGDQPYQGLFVHSGSSVSVDLPENQEYRLNFKCLFLPESSEKADDQVFEIHVREERGKSPKDKADDIVVFSHTSQKTARSSLRDSDFEATVHGRVTFTVKPKRATSWGWTVFSVNTCRPLSDNRRNAP